MGWVLMATGPAWLTFTVSTVIGLGGLAVLIALALRDEEGSSW